MYLDATSRSEKKTLNKLTFKPRAKKIKNKKVGIQRR